MARVSRAIAHLSAEEVQQKIKTATNFRQQQKWLVVYNALVDPRPAAEIAKHSVLNCLPCNIPRAMDKLIGQVLHERYYIQSLLDRKTGRRTFLARDLQTRSSVVIKLLLFGPDFTWDDLKLFEREAETLKALDHPAIPKYLDCFEVETEFGKGFSLVQSYIEARSLQDWVKSGRTFSQEELKTIAEELLEILDYLHNRQPPVVHRDINPSNVLLGDRSGNSLGQVYLVDFGSVQTVKRGGTVTVVGTYGYMPPEQFGGRTLPASDLYSVGATLIYLSTGQHPADLPQKDLQVEFEPFVNLSQSFIRWIRWVNDPSLSRRPASAKEALEVDFYQHFRSTSGQRFSLDSHSPLSSIQLKATSTAFEIEVPLSQVRISASKKIYPLRLRILSGIEVLVGILSGIDLLSVVFILVALFTGFWVELFLFTFLFFIYFCLEPHLFLIKFESYKITIHSEEHSISVSLVSRNSKNSMMVLSQERLHSISAGPNTSIYQLNICCYNFSKAVHITGNHAEVQWLCDKLNKWTGLNIKYQDTTPTF